MKHVKLTNAARTTTFAGALLLGATAVAQPSAYPQGGAPGQAPAAYQGYYAAPQYAPPLPSLFQPRRGLMIAGFSAGLGAMGNENGAIECLDCETSPVSFAADVRLGGMLTDRLGLMVEAQIDSSIVQTYTSDGYAIDGTKSISQAAVFVAAQYHVSPRLYVRGGLGIANLSFDYDDAYGQVSEQIGAGTAAMGVVGYEIMSTRGLSLDLVGRLTVGTYDDIQETVSAGSLGFAVTYY